MIKEILDEMNLENGSNYKINVLKKYSDNETLKRVLKMTYDSVSFTYGVTMRNVITPDNHNGSITLEDALDVLSNDLATRKTTGNNAINAVDCILQDLSEEDSYVLEKILDRDLRINIGRTNINKVFKGLIL